MIVCSDCKTEVKKKDEATCPRCGKIVHKKCLHPRSETCWICQEELCPWVKKENIS